MDSVKLTGKKPKMIAHRGLSGIECENTCPAFVLAGSRSYYGIETDMHFSKDGKRVICHDSDLARVAGGRHIVIEESTYEELKSVPLVSPRHQDKRSDLFVPLLSDYIAICKKYDKYAVLEFKQNFTPEQVDAVMADVDELDYRDKTIFISFYPWVLIDLKKRYPACACQFLTDRTDEEVLSLLDEHHLDLDICYPSLTKEFVDIVHARGHLVNCWTVDDEEAAKALIEMGVDFITSNILE